MAITNGAIRTRLFEFLEREGDRIVRDLQDSFQRNNRNATGKTSKGLKSEVKGNSLIVDGSEHIKWLVDGRDPTEQKGTPGKSVWFDDLVEWVEARGFEASAVFPIFKKIHEEGFDPTPALISDVINDQLIDRITKEAADVVLAQGVKMIEDTVKAFEQTFGKQ